MAHIVQYIKSYVMKTIFKELFYDREFVDNIKKSKVTPDQLYNELINGRITLKEYLSAL